MHRHVRYAFTFGLLCAGAFIDAANLAKAAEPQMLLLWPEGAPGAVGSDDKDKPAIFVHKPAPEKANGAAVIICPGGGYGHLAVTYEGHEVADWYNEYGVTGFVLRYRLAPRYKHPSPMQDVQRAIRTVRANAKEWGLDPNRIGVMGFSAGGHLASTAATHFDDGDSAAKDEIDRVSCRPDFAVLAYPVITFGEFTHSGSRDNLLGKNPDPKLVELMSNEKQVTEKTPPTFLFHTGTDTAVPPENSLLFYAAMRKAKVPAELHVYEEGRHGVGLATKDPTLSTWPECLATWLEHRKLLEKKKETAAK